MIVKLKQDSTVEEAEILIKYDVMTKDIERIMTILESATTRIACIDDDNGEKLVNLSDIYYFESVDKKTFVYCKKAVYRTNLRLYQIADDFAKMGFVQISKSCVLNVNVLDSIIPLPSSRMEGTLTNGERVHITRNYLENIKRALKDEVQL